MTQLKNYITEVQNYIHNVCQNATLLSNQHKKANLSGIKGEKKGEWRPKKEKRQLKN